MAMTNISKDKTHVEFDRLLCSKEATGGIKDEVVFLSVVHIILTITAFLGNALIQVAFYKETSLHPPNSCFAPYQQVTSL